MSGIRVFGHHDGAEVREAVLEDGPVRVAIIGWGAAVRDWRVDGVPMCLGFERFEDYPVHSRSFGIVAGRVANRIAKGRFSLGGKTYQLATNNGPNHLHGGKTGLGKRVWGLEADSAGKAVRLTYFSPEGEEAYPGAVLFEVTYRLSGHLLTCEMRADPDRPTPVNMAQHNYYNLAGAGDIRGHLVRIDAEAITPVDAGLIPDGSFAPVAGTRFDFRAPRLYAEADADGAGHDHNYVLRPGRDRNAPAAEVSAAGRRLAIWTDQPGMQLYTAKGLDVEVPGLDGLRYGAYGGLCLEAQNFPDAINHPHFPNPVVTPEMPYRQHLSISIGPA